MLHLSAGNTSEKIAGRCKFRYRTRERRKTKHLLCHSHGANVVVDKVTESQRKAPRASPTGADEAREEPAKRSIMGMELWKATSQGSDIST